MFAESMMYQIEVHTQSESEETRIVRFKPSVLQKALDKSFEDKMKVKWLLIACYFNAILKSRI